MTMTTCSSVLVVQCLKVELLECHCSIDFVEAVLTIFYEQLCNMLMLILKTVRWAAEVVEAVSTFDS